MRRTVRALLAICLPVVSALLWLAQGPELGWAAPGDDKTDSAGAAPTLDSAAVLTDKAALARKRRFRRSRLTYDETEITADRRKMLLTTGEDRAVELDFDTNSNNGIAIGNPQVVATTLVKIGEKRQLVFKPLKAGETSVTLRDNEGNIRLIFTIRVTGSSLLRIASELRSLLRDIEGLEVRIVGPKVVIEGEVLVPSDFARLLTVTQDKSYDPFILNLATLSPLALGMLAKKIQEDINTFAANVVTRVVNGLVFLEGTVDRADQAKRAAQVALLYFPDLRPGNPLERDQTAQRMPPRSPVQNFIVVNPPPAKKQEKLVRITVNFVELDKDYNKFFGFQWQPGFAASPSITVGAAAAGGAAADSSSLSGTISNLLPKLQSAQTAGYARILKTGTLIVRSGQPASIQELTQIPFAVTGANGVSTPTKTDVGLAVGVTPVILGQSEDIQLELKMSQNNLVGRATAGSAPITANHTVETRIYVKSNESAAVAGVTSSDIGTDFNKDAPDSGGFSNSATALFNMTHTKSYRKKKSQFVIFVTPQIIENASEGTEDMKRNFRVKVK